MNIPSRTFALNKPLRREVRLYVPNSVLLVVLTLVALALLRPLAIGEAVLSASIESASCIAPPAGIVAWYPGDGNALDIQGGAGGTLQGGATFAPGMVNQAFSLNGTSAYVCADADAAQDPTNAGSMDAWVKFNKSPSDGGHIMEIIGKGANCADFDLQAEGDNRFHFYVGCGNQTASTTVI